MMTTCVVVCRETEAEAKAAYQSIIDHLDGEAARNYVASQGVNLDAFDEAQRVRFIEKFAASAGSTPLVGTPEQVADGFAAIKRSGIDGVLIGLIDYVEELKFFEERVMPVLKQRGLRV